MHLLLLILGWPFALCKVLCKDQYCLGFDITAFGLYTRIVIGCFFLRPHNSLLEGATELKFTPFYCP